MMIQPRMGPDPAVPAPKPLAGKKVCIDPGHGGDDSGAIGTTGYQEKEANLDIALHLRDDLVELGATVVMTRDTDRSVAKPGASSSEELQARCDVANKASVDVFISCHNNAWTDPKKNGMEVYQVRQAPAETKLLARSVYEQLKADLGTKPNGILEAGFYVLRHTNMPAILCEFAYLSNPAEEALLKTPEFRDKAAHSVAEGVVDYFANQGKPDEGPKTDDEIPRPADQLPLDLQQEAYLLASH